MLRSELLQQVVSAFVRVRPDAELDLDPVCPHAAIACDEALLDEMLAPDAPVQSRLRLWTNSACIVLPRRFRAQLSDPAIVDFARRSGFAVSARASGGTVVLHRAGILNISLAMRLPDGPVSIASAYAPLVQTISAAMASLGLATQHGNATCAFCDGAFNILWRGRKLAGTSAFFRRRDGVGACLSHAYLAVSGDFAADVRMVQETERRLGMQSSYVPAAHVCVAEALGRPAP